MANSSFASVLKSGIQAPTSVTFSVQHKTHQINTQNMQQQPIGVEAIMLSMQQSMKDFMTFMQETMQELMRNQNILLPHYYATLRDSPYRKVQLQYSRI